MPVVGSAWFKCVEAVGRITIRGQSGGVLVWLSVWSKVQTTLMIINPALVAGLLRSAMATLLEQEKLCGRQKAVWSSATVLLTDADAAAVLWPIAHSMDRTTLLQAK